MFKDIDAYFFDLDGTLVDSKLDFDKMREQLGFPPKVPILEYIDCLKSQSDKDALLNKVIDLEMQGAHESEVFTGVLEFLEKLNTLNIPMAILTRNCKQATDLMIKKFNIPITKVITREDFPPKPDPTALLHLSEYFKVPVERCIYIGDYKFDLEAAQNAKMKSALFLNERNSIFEEMADFSFLDWNSFFKN